MSEALPDLAEPPALAQSAWAQAVLVRQVERLERLSEAGLRMAEAIADEGKDAMAFGRVARAVRMAGLLQARLIEEIDKALARGALAAGTRGDALAEAIEDAVRGGAPYQHKRRVEAIVGRIAEAACDGDEARADRLVIEAGERLDDDDIYGEVLTRPVGELVALICRDLGLKPDWDRLAEEAWAQEEIKNGAETSPFLKTRPLPPAGEGDHEVVERAWNPPQKTTPNPTSELKASPWSAPAACGDP